MRNIILALAIAAPAASAFAQPSSRMQAVSGSECIECHMAGQPAAAVSAPQSMRIDPSLITGSGRMTASASGGTDHSLRIGRVETVNEVPFENGTKGRGQGNGVIISPCYMLTNFHGVYGETTDPDTSLDHSVDFFFGQGQSSFRWRVKGSPTHSGVLTSSGGGDWALVRLEKCPGKKVGWPELDLRSAQELRNQNLTLVGVRPGPSNGSVVVKSCLGQGRERTTGGLSHNCPIVDGLSASAIFTGENRLAAISVGMVGSQAVGVTMAEVFADPQARALIEADKAKFASEQNLGPVHAALTSGRVANL